MRQFRRDLARVTPGWFEPEEGESVHRWALETPGPYLELGSYCGKSTVWLGDAAERQGTLLFAVDWHRGSPEIKEGLGDTLPRLRATLDRAELDGAVVPIVGTTDQVGRYWATPVSFAFIDACHDAQVLTDVDTWQHHVTDLLAFHDSTWPYVHEAIARAINLHGWRLRETSRSLTLLERR